MAVKIVRQEKQIALLGAPMSAAALAPGGEGAPSALRKAGLVSQLKSIGYEVADMGDDPPQVYRIDEESPRARNLTRVLAALETLRPRVEIAAKSGALPLILSGDGSVALATVAGLRRYFRHVSVLYADADACLQTPATTNSGCVDGMAVSHLVGRGASELVRFWSEPPLVRDPDLALFGVSRLDPSEEQVLQTAPLRRYLAADVKRKTPAKTASEAVERIHGDTREFVLHFDVDMISGFKATNLPSSEGLNLEEIREAFEILITQRHLAAIEVVGYNPERDPDGSAAAMIVEFLAGVLAVRLEKAKAFAAAAATPQAPGSAVASAPIAHASASSTPVVSAGEAWSSDMLEDAQPAGDDPAKANDAEPDDSHS